SLLQRLGGDHVLAQLAVRDAAEVLQAGDFGRVDSDIHQREGFVDPIKCWLALRGRELGLREEAQQRGTRAFRGRAPEAGLDLGTHDLPVVALRSSLCREEVEGEALLGREGRVTEEVVEALAETGGDDLERPDRRTDQTGLDLRDEALGELLARKLGLAHPALTARASDTFSEARCRRRFDAPHGCSSVTELTVKRRVSTHPSCSASVDSRGIIELMHGASIPHWGAGREGRRT